MHGVLTRIFQLLIGIKPVVGDLLYPRFETRNTILEIGLNQVQASLETYLPHSETRSASRDVNDQTRRIS